MLSTCCSWCCGREADLGTLAILTLGVDILLLTELTRRIGTDVLSIGAPWGSTSAELFGIRIAASRIAGVAAALLVAAFAAVFKFTAGGRDARRGRGRSDRVADGDPARPGVVGGVGDRGRPGRDRRPLPDGLPGGGRRPVACARSRCAAFPAVVLGGFDSPAGALLGGLVDRGRTELTRGLPERPAVPRAAASSTIAPYVVMLAVLLVRPSGLFGTKEITRV